MVFAGVRKEADGEAVKAANPDKIVPIILDVTNPEHVEAAKATVQKELASRQQPLVRACGWVVDTDLVVWEERSTTRL